MKHEQQAAVRQEIDQRPHPSFLIRQSKPRGDG
jgi:hypothetical protein